MCIENKILKQHFIAWYPVANGAQNKTGPPPTEYAGAVCSALIEYAHLIDAQNIPGYNRHFVLPRQFGESLRGEDFTEHRLTRLTNPHPSGAYCQIERFAVCFGDNIDCAASKILPLVEGSRWYPIQGFMIGDAALMVLYLHTHSISHFGQADLFSLGRKNFFGVAQ